MAEGAPPAKGVEAMRSAARVRIPPSSRHVAASDMQLAAAF